MIIESHERQGGWRYRRHACAACSHRWSTRHEGNEILTVKRVGNARGFRTLAPDAVRQILQSTETNRSLAKTYNVRHSTIQNIRTGKTYKDIYLEVFPDQAEKICSQCIHWIKRCSMGFPEAGGIFASECNLFLTEPLPKPAALELAA